MMKVVQGFILALLFTCAVPSDVLEDCACSFFIQKDNNKEELFKLASLRLNECSLYRSECKSHCKEQFNEFIKNEAAEEQSLYDLACKKYQYDIQDAELVVFSHGCGYPWASVIQAEKKLCCSGGLFCTKKK